MPYSSSKESPTSAVRDVGRQEEGRVADGVRLRPYCVARGDLSRAATSSFIPEDKLSRRAFALAVMVDVVPGRRTMHYGVEVSWRCRFK